MFRGVFTALVTPFKHGKVDEKGLERLIEFQIKKGIDGLVPCGTTGESPTLSYAEHERVIALTVEIANGRIPVLAGTGSNATDEAIYLSKFAEKIGCEGVLLVAPYYNRPTQAGLLAHFKKIAHAISIPIVLYNIPGRTGVNMLPSTVIELGKDKQFWGIKEASGNINQALEIMSESALAVVSGDDSLTLPLMSVGAAGVISVASNIVPDRIVQLINHVRKGSFDKAQKLNLTLFPLFRDLFVETNPTPVKAAMAMLDMIEEDVRLPLCTLTKKNKLLIRNLLKKLKISK